MQKHAKRCKKCTCGIPDERLGGLFQLKVIKEGQENKNMAKISYSGVVLTPEAKQKLLDTFSWKIPEGWEIVCHHMTITMGELPPELKDTIGLPAVLKVITFEMDDKVAAVQVIPPPEMAKFVKNKYPHITFAVNRSAGGKPAMSNQMIADRIKANTGPDGSSTTISPFEISGTISEVPFST